MVTRPHCETNVTLACQNRCVGCNHFIPMQTPWFVEPEVMEYDLVRMSRIIHFERYNLVGGEPTLHPRIVELLEIVRRTGIADSLEITSNGQGFERWPDTLYSLIDELIVTPYKLDHEQREAIAAKCLQFRVSLQWHPVIFTDCAYKDKASADLAANRYRACWYNVNRHVIDGGYFYRCCTAPFIPSLLLDLPKEHDGIAIEGLTEERLNEYLHQVETPESCYVCASNMGAVIPWRETSRELWKGESIR